MAVVAAEGAMAVDGIDFDWPYDRGIVVVVVEEEDTVQRWTVEETAGMM